MRVTANNKQETVSEAGGEPKVVTLGVEVRKLEAETILPVADVSGLHFGDASRFGAFSANRIERRIHTMAALDELFDIRASRGATHSTVLRKVRDARHMGI